MQDGRALTSRLSSVAGPSCIEVTP